MTYILENQMEKNMDDEMEITIMGLYELYNGESNGQEYGK